MKNKRTLIFSLLLVVAILLAGCDALGGAADETTDTPLVPDVVTSSAILAEGNLVPRDFAALAFQASGEVAQILVEEGDEVNAGDVLARLGNREQIEAQLAAAQLELAAAQQALDDLHENAALAASQAMQAKLDAERALLAAGEHLDAVDTPEYDQELDDVKILVTDEENDLEDAQDDFDEYDDLAEDNSVRQEYEDALDTAQVEYNDAARTRDRLELDLEQALADVASAEAALADAEREYEAWQNGPDPDEVALAEARVTSAEAQVAAAQAALDNITITAPFDGTIVDVDVTLNENVLATQPVITIADVSEWYVETDDLTEIEVVKIAVDQQVTIQPDALSDEELTGTVESISDVFELKRGDVTYTVRILVDDFDLPLRWGMSVIVTFER